MEKILVSACLVGQKCRYDGKSNYQEQLMILQDKYEFILICPEVDGGLSIPRYPSEIKGGRVINNQGEDVSAYFIKGAKHALELAKKYGITKAILKSKSPSCGNRQIYDGNFNKHLIEGDGITASLLKAHGITIYDENHVSEVK